MRWSYYRDYFPRFPRSRPRVAKGGIKAQSKRGGFGQSWWAKRWIAVLESFDIGARLGRGRSYARGGQVLSIEVEKGKVTSRVQGSRPKPYAVTIEINVLTDADWKKLTDTLAGQALFAAKLLAGEMPQDIEKAFQDAGLSLFPQKLRDLQTSCSCPDFSNPCKHIAAVYYLLGEEFDRDPFLLFKLRGLSREELVERLGRLGPGREETGTSEAPAEREPLRAEGRSFWEGAPLPQPAPGEDEAPPVAAALPKRLGSFPFWRGHERFLDALEPVYKRASERGNDIFLGGPRKG
jgi:uncharacterized Zn finger protein